MILGSVRFSELCEYCKLDVIKFFDILFQTFKQQGYDLSWKHLGLTTEYQITVEKIKESMSRNEEDILELKPEDIVETKQEEQENQKFDSDQSDLSISSEPETLSSVKLTENCQQRRIFKNQKEALAAKDKVEGEMIEIRGETYYFMKRVCKDGYKRWSVGRHLITLDLGGK